MEKEEKIKITAVVKTKNCDEYICTTLEAIKSFDEIIVVDEHSGDDTIEIAKEYKARIIFANKNELKESLNQAILEARNDWIFLIEEDEIIPDILLKKLEEIINNEKFNKNFITLPIKTHYLNKELKCAKSKALRLFKKDKAELINNYSLNLKLKSTKSSNLNYAPEKDKEYILKYANKNIADYCSVSIEKIRALFKNKPQIHSSIVFAPFLCFVYWYIFKKGFMDGKRGFIFAKQMANEVFVLNVLHYEKKIKEQENDI